MHNQTSLAEFHEWFGSSLAADKSGSPLPLYHGTDVRFSAFKPSDRGLFGSGLYLTPYSGNAQEYGQYLIQVYASIKSPLTGTQAELRSMRERGEGDIAFTERLKSFGYDGVFVVDAWGDPFTVVAFESHQVKQANVVGDSAAAGRIALLVH